MSNRETFIRWFAWSVRFKDVDPAVWMTNYLNERYEHNEEQRFWLAWLYGNTYYLPTSWVIMNEFPDFELATYERMNDWNTKNFRRLRYQTDTKWSKGHLAEMFKSYRKMIGNKTQSEFFAGFGGFDDLFEYVQKTQHKFGRYCTWFYLQHLQSTCGMSNLQPKTLLLDDISGSRSHRSGLLLAAGKSESLSVKLKEISRPTTSEISWLEGFAADILVEAKERFPEYADEFTPFTMETCLCSFKKLFRSRDGRYLGYYNDRVSEEIQKVEQDGWDGIEWDVLWQAREETLDPRLSKKRANIQKEYFPFYMKYGKLMREDWMFSDVQPVKQGVEEFLL